MTESLGIVIRPRPAYVFIGTAWLAIPSVMLLFVSHWNEVWPLHVVAFLIPLVWLWMQLQRKIMISDDTIRVYTWLGVKEIATRDVKSIDRDLIYQIGIVYSESGSDTVYIINGRLFTRDLFNQLKRIIP